SLPEALSYPQRYRLCNRRAIGLTAVVSIVLMCSDQGFPIARTLSFVCGNSGNFGLFCKKTDLLSKNTVTRRSARVLKAKPGPHSPETQDYQPPGKKREGQGDLPTKQP